MADPRKWTTSANTMDTHQTEKHDKIEESSPETLDNPRKALSEPGYIPGSSGESRVVLLPVEPYMIHVYWDVNPVELEKVKHQINEEYAQSQAILRCHDITNTIFDGTNANGSFDMHIDLLSKCWYVHLGSPEKSYFIELGFKTEDGRFYPIARSNIADIPPAWPAPESVQHYMHVEGDYDLLETVPAPIDAQPSEGLTPPNAYRAEPELPSAAERDRRYETRSPFKAEENSSRAEGHKKKGQPKKSKLDLTEITEQRFVSGVSSNR